MITQWSVSSLVEFIRFMPAVIWMLEIVYFGFVIVGFIGKQVNCCSIDLSETFMWKNWIYVTHPAYVRSILIEMEAFGTF